eukprot:5025261-Amphidinium_carterae.1
MEEISANFLVLHAMIAEIRYADTTDTDDPTHLAWENEPSDHGRGHSAHGGTCSADAQTQCSPAAHANSQ